MANKKMCVFFIFIWVNQPFKSHKLKLQNIVWLPLLGISYYYQEQCTTCQFVHVSTFISDTFFFLQTGPHTEEGGTVALFRGTE